MSNLVKIEVRSTDFYLKRYKFKINKNKSVAFLQSVLRKEVNLKDSEALFLFWCNKYLYSGTTLLVEINERHKNEEDIIMLNLYKENAFGRKTICDCLFNLFYIDNGNSEKINDNAYNDLVTIEKIISEFDRDFFTRD